MAIRLEVDAVGLRNAAASSAAVAETLTGVNAGNPSSSHPSAAGVAAMNAALASMQSRQSARMTGQAGDLSAGSARYDTTDAAGGDAITVTV